MTNWGVEVVNLLHDRDAGPPLPPFVSHLRLDRSMQVEAVEPGRVVHRWTSEPHLGMPDGFVQGGMLCAIADIGQGLAMISALDAFETWVTLDLQIRFLRLIAIGEVVRVESRVVNKSRNNAVVETAFVSAEGKLLACVTGGWTKSARERAWGLDSAAA